MSFVYELPYAVCNGRVSGCCHIRDFAFLCLNVGETGDNCNSFWKFGCNCFLIEEYQNDLILKESSVCYKFHKVWNVSSIRFCSNNY